MKEREREIATINSSKDALPSGVKIRMYDNSDKPEHFNVVVDGLEFKILFSDFDDPKIWKFSEGNESNLKNKDNLLQSIKTWLKLPNSLLPVITNEESIMLAWECQNDNVIAWEQYESELFHRRKIKVVCEQVAFQH